MTPGDILNTFVLAFVAAGLGSLFWVRLKEEKLETRASSAELNDLRTELKGNIAELRAELKGDIAELRRELAGVRSDVTQVALAVEPRPPPASEA